MLHFEVGRTGLRILKSLWLWEIKIFSNVFRFSIRILYHTWKRCNRDRNLLSYLTCWSELQKEKPGKKATWALKGKWCIVDAPSSEDIINWSTETRFHIIKSPEPFIPALFHAFCLQLHNVFSSLIINETSKSILAGTFVCKARFSVVKI